jgi:hypothetical protein
MHGDHHRVQNDALGQASTVAILSIRAKRFEVSHMVTITLPEGLTRGTLANFFKINPKSGLKRRLKYFLVV